MKKTSSEDKWSFGKNLEDFVHDIIDSTSGIVEEFAESKPLCNISRTSKDYLVEVIAPGFAKSDFNIYKEENFLVISVDKKIPDEPEREWIRKRFRPRAFHKKIRIPDSVNTDDISATYNSGILAVSIPRMHENKESGGQRIHVN
jgi:HSP20 family protein